MRDSILYPTFGLLALTFLVVMTVSGDWRSSARQNFILVNDWEYRVVTRPQFESRIPACRSVSTELHRVEHVINHLCYL